MVRLSFPESQTEAAGRVQAAKGRVLIRLPRLLSQDDASPNERLCRQGWRYSQAARGEKNVLTSSFASRGSVISGRKGFARGTGFCAHPCKSMAAPGSGLPTFK